MQIINFDPSLLGTGELFPPAISGINGIGYHGTSSYYSNDIETNGFSTSYQSIFPYISELIAEGERLNINVRKVKGFSYMKSISFSPVSETCLHYIQDGLAGGQGLNYTKELYNEIFANAEYDKSSELAKKLLELSDLIDSIRSSPSVIYAVDLTKVASVKIHFNTVTKAIHVEDEIDKKNLIAKMTIPINQVTPLTLHELHDMILKIYYRDSPHFIKNLS